MNVIRKMIRKAKTAFQGLKSKFDKEGSYTGTPSDGTKHPEQDADDL